MSELVTGMFVGLAGTALILLVLYVVMLGFSWVIAVIRAATNKQLGSGKKIGWILFSIFIPFGGVVYFVFPERNKFLKAFGWITFVLTLMIMGYYIASVIDPSPVTALPPQVAAAPAPAVVDPQSTPQAIPEPTSEAVPQTSTPTGERVPEYKWTKTPEEAKMMEQAARSELKFLAETNPDKKREIYNDTINIYSKVIGSNLQNVAVLVSRGRLRELMLPGSGKVDYELALGAADSLLKKNPYNVEILYQRALAYKGVRRMEEAKEDMEEVVRLRPSDDFYKRELRKLIDDKPFGL